VSPPIELVSKALRPIVWVLQSSARVLLRPLGVKEVMAGDAVTSADELRAIVDEAEGAGVIPRAQEEMLHNVFDFVDREAADVMVPAGDVTWLDAALGPPEALDELLRTPHSRAPVARGSLDRVIGVVHVRELARATRDGEPATIEPLARPVPVVPETKDLGALLRDLREAHQQMAIVVDEYGGTAGIVTIEDILEEIVGEIEDEYDLPDDRIEWLDERTVEVAGSMSVDDFEELLGVEVDARRQRTLAGLVFAVLGRRPRPGDVVEVDGVRFTVEALDGVRITRLRVTLPEGASRR